MSLFLKLQLLVIFTEMSLTIAAQNNKIIRPGEIWPDNNGSHIQAHGGGINRIGDIYYWYGEKRSKGLDTNHRYVSCYSSNNLIN